MKTIDLRKLFKQARGNFGHKGRPGQVGGSAKGGRSFSPESSSDMAWARDFDAKLKQKAALRAERDAKAAKELPSWMKRKPEPKFDSERARDEDSMKNLFGEYISNHEVDIDSYTDAADWAADKLGMKEGDDFPEEWAQWFDDEFAKYSNEDTEN